jgi:hypothetical protein
VERMLDRNGVRPGQERRGEELRRLCPSLNHARKHGGRAAKEVNLEARKPGILETGNGFN